MELFIKVGDRVRHNMTGAIATVSRVRMELVNKQDGYVPFFRLDFGHSQKGPFKIEMNGKEFRREALTLLTTND